jgi:hypothetical protein
MGAFIQAGGGRDFILGTGGADTVAAGFGADTILVNQGSTVYVPMENGSTENINFINAPEYGAGPFPKNTLVLPDGIKPSDLQYTVLPDPSGTDGGSDSRILELTYGASKVDLTYDSGPASWELDQPGDTEDNDGVNRFVFSDGTVLTRAQVLALAAGQGSSTGPAVTVHTQFMAENSTVAASSLFTATDPDGTGATLYQIIGDPTGGSYFTLGSTTYAPGATINVTGAQLSMLQYHTGSSPSLNELRVAAFDGRTWSDVAPCFIAVTNSGGGGQGGQSDNTFQFGPGITPASLTATMADSTDLVISDGNTADTVELQGFDLSDPLGSSQFQQFRFADGTTLSLMQLLREVQHTAGFVRNANGTTALYYFGNADGTPYHAYTYNAQGKILQTYYCSVDANGATDVAQSLYNSDGSATFTELATAADGSVISITLGSRNALGQTVTSDTVNADGSTSKYNTIYNSDGSYSSTLLTTPAGGGSQDTTSETWTYNSGGQELTDDKTYPDGSTDNITVENNPDGSYNLTEVVTPAGGGTPTTILEAWNSSGQMLTYDATNPDGSTDDVSYTYNSDGSLSSVEVLTPASGGGATTTVTDFDVNWRLVSEDVVNPDGSTVDSTYAYNADGSYVQTSLSTPAAGGPVTTKVSDYDNNDGLLSANSYTPSSDGSYTDQWEKSDGSAGSYWWNTSSAEYQANWHNSDGSYSTDDYQYGSGGTPGTNGVSFTETFRDSSGDHGTRQYDASTGVTSLTWYSSATGTLTGTTTDNGFIGLQDQGELTNTVNDPSFFNPAVSPSFQSFLAGH